MTSREAIELGQAYEVARQAEELVKQAYALVENSGELREYITFEADVGLNNRARRMLLEQLKVDAPEKAKTLGKDPGQIPLWFYGLEPGSSISLHGRVSGGPS